AYGSRLQYLIRRLRTDTGSPGAAAFIGKINPGSDAFHWRTQIQDQQQQATQTLPMTYLVDTGGLGKLWDQLHYDARGQIGLGERFASRFLQQHRPARTDRPPAAAIPAAAPMPPSPTTATARPDNENTRPISRLVSTSPETTVHAASSGTIASSNTVPSSKQQTLRQQAERQAERRAAWQQRRQQQRQRQYLRLLEYQQRQQQYRQRTPE
ncbi:MAG TPA: sialate O-acetylesterase, partial [Thiolinea sp.]|nr:sialate O-acetylesterase [Thiolinea sp.]